MNKNLDYEKIRHIIEKIENNEPLNKDEEVYSMILKKLIETKRDPIIPDEDFKDKLKSELLSEYARIYENKRIINRFLDSWNFSLLRFSVSFCLVFFISFNFYGNLLNMSKIDNDQPSGAVNEISVDKSSESGISSKSLKKSENNDSIQDAAPMATSLGSSAESGISAYNLEKNSNADSIKDSAPMPTSLKLREGNGGGFNFGSDKVSNDIKGSDENFIGPAYPLLIMFLISSAVSILFSFKRRKPKS